jgi:hypothetical protein
MMVRSHWERTTGFMHCVSKSTISTDLESFEVTSKLKRQSKRGRKGEGRPKGSKTRKPKPRRTTSKSALFVVGGVT